MGALGYAVIVERDFFRYIYCLACQRVCRLGCIPEREGVEGRGAGQMPSQIFSQWFASAAVAAGDRESRRSGKAVRRAAGFWFRSVLWSEGVLADVEGSVGPILGSAFWRESSKRLWNANFFATEI